VDRIEVRSGEAPPKHEKCLWPNCPERDLMERITTVNGQVQYVCSHTGRLVFLKSDKIEER